MAAAIERAAARLDRALEAHRAAVVETCVASLHLICLQIRKEFPEAATVVFEWSDQGDWLLVDHLVDFLGHRLDAEWEDGDCLAVNLEGNVESIWSTFMEPTSPARFHQSPNQYRLPIDATLIALTASEKEQSDA